MFGSHALDNMRLSIRTLVIEVLFHQLKVTYSFSLMASPIAYLVDSLLNQGGEEICLLVTRYLQDPPIAKSNGGPKRNFPNSLLMTDSR